MAKLKMWLENIIPDAQAVFRRFPLAAFLVGCFTIVLLIDNNFGGLSNEMMMRLVGGLVLAAYMAVILTLVGEGCKQSVPIILKLIIVGLCLLAGYFFRNLAFLTPAAIGASILFLGNAPFFKKNRNDVAVWDFTHKLWTAVLFTVAGSMIYTMGVFAISAALNTLFGLNIIDLVEDWMLPIGLAFLAPMAWMSMLPRHDEDDGDSLRNPGFISKAVGFLGTWILAPLTLIYAVIILAYGVKIAAMQSVPNGEIAELVTPFLIIGTLTWLILDPPFIQEKRLARWYAKFWFPLSIPAALLLAYAVFVRIGQYGWTIERYLLVLASIWALGIACWFIFRSKTKRDIRIIPGFAALLLALASLGPWGADAVSSFSQNGRLKSALMANQMLDGDGYLKPTSDFRLKDIEQAVKAKGTLNYLVTHRKSAKIRAFIPRDETPDIFDKESNKDYLNSIAINKRFGLDKVQIPSRYNILNWYKFSVGNPVAISGYDYISSPQNFRKYGKHSAHKTSYKFGDMQVNANNQGIIINKIGGEELGRFQIWDWLKERNVNGNKIEMEPLVTVLEKDDIKIALFITRAEYSDDLYNSRSLQYMILVKGVVVD